jgi:hypothetical protein
MRFCLSVGHLQNSGHLCLPHSSKTNGAQVACVGGGGHRHTHGMDGSRVLTTPPPTRLTSRAINLDAYRSADARGGSGGSRRRCGGGEVARATRRAAAGARAATCRATRRRSSGSKRSPSSMIWTSEVARCVAVACATKRPQTQAQHQIQPEVFRQPSSHRTPQASQPIHHLEALASPFSVQQPAWGRTHVMSVEGGTRDTLTVAPSMGLSDASSNCCALPAYTSNPHSSSLSTQPPTTPELLEPLLADVPPSWVCPAHGGAVSWVTSALSPSLSRTLHAHCLSLCSLSLQVRRSSSRFCLGVEHGDYNGTELFGVGMSLYGHGNVACCAE